MQHGELGPVIGDHTWCYFEAGCGCAFEVYHDRNCKVSGAAASNCGDEHKPWLEGLITSLVDRPLLSINFTPISNN